MSIEKGKIFTYNGSTYIGSGHINKIVKNEEIDKDERAIFIEKLDNFLKKFTTNQQKFEFLGVENEMEFRKLKLKKLFSIIMKTLLNILKKKLKPLFIN